MRIYRRDDMHLEGNPEVLPRDERLRELVDDLPKNEMLAVSLMFFGSGSPTLESVASDMGVSVYKVKEFLHRGQERLKEALQEEDGVGSL